MEDKKEELQEKVEEVPEKNLLKRAWREAKDFGAFLMENPMRLFQLGSGLVGGAMTIIGLISRFGDGGHNCEVPDEITGLNFRTSHPLTNIEIMELSDRLSAGESKGEALSNMGVLKEQKKR